MAANVRYRSVYYNTTGTSVQWTLEILDSEPVGQVINFESTKPDESFEGLTKNLEPGVYPSSLKFGMFIREAPIAIRGTTFGPSHSFIDDISTAAEGRFLARLYKDGVLHFVGPIIYDQCSWEDQASPYLMNITAVDGMNRWKTTDYISEVGQLVYYSRSERRESYDTSTMAYDGPMIGVSVIVLEHSVVKFGNLGGWWNVNTTFVHREIYAKNSPGTGWVSQGQGLWAKAVSYTNETITEDAPESYHLTRDIDNEKHRTVLEYFTRAVTETNMTGEYISPASMFTTNIEWREHSMTTGDPANLTRLPETPFIGKTWADAMQEICRLLFLRVYYSKGRYHFEQISTRDDSTLTRYSYQSDGTLIGSEVASLDLNFDTLDIKPGVGGVYKFLAPFRSVEATISLDGSNYLEGVDWKDGVFGTKYVGRVKKIDGVQKMFVKINVAATSTFDQDTLALFPPAFINAICEHTTYCVYSVRLTRVSDGVTYWLEQTAGGPPHVFSLKKGTWEVTYREIDDIRVNFGTPNKKFSVTNYGYTLDSRTNMLAETLPGSVDDMYDIHVSIVPRVEFVNPIGANIWTNLHPDKFWYLINTSYNRLIFYSVTDGDYSEWTESAGNIELVYISENDVDNSIKVKTELQWADTGQFDRSIEVYDGTNWVRSSEWSIGGIGTPVPIGELLVTEIMSLRTLPRKLYSGSYLSTLPNAETRFQRGTSFYLPLSCNKDTDVDTFQGEFLEIARTAAPEVETVESPIAGEPLPGLVGADPPEDFDSGLYFETDAAITALDVLTQVAIVNTLGIYVASGETVTIVNATTGESENVTLTQEILPADTVMYFESNVFTYSYPDGSPIVLADGGVVIESGGSKYRYSNRLYNGATHTVPVAVLDLAALDGLSNQFLNNKVWIYRNGQKMIGLDYTTIGLVGGIYWWYDSTTNDISVHADFEFVDEWIDIDIDLNR